MTEEELFGGHTTPGVVRVGGTVRRPRTRRSAFSSAAVAWLNGHDFRYAPRYLGVDAAGRDIFSYVSGVTTDHPTQRAESAYGVIAAILRELHDLTRNSDLVGDGTCLVHGDPGPFNAVCHGGVPVALIDWDSARPGNPITDIGYAGWTWCIQSEGSVPVEDQARRLRQFRDAYDPHLKPAELLDAVTHEQQRIIQVESTVLSDPAQPTERREHAASAVAWAQSDKDLVTRYMTEFQDALTATT